MTRRDQEEAEQAAYEEYMQAMYDEQCRLQQLDDEHEWLRAEVKRLTAENEALRGERAAVVAALRRASNRELTARIRHLEAAVAEARAEAAQWAAELDGERAAVVAYLRESAAVADEFGAVPFAIAEEAEAIERGEHRAGGAQ